MPVPTIPQAVFLFLLGGVFLHFLIAGGIPRTHRLVPAARQSISAW